MAFIVPEVPRDEPPEECPSTAEVSSVPVWVDEDSEGGSETAEVSVPVASEEEGLEEELEELGLPARPV